LKRVFKKPFPGPFSHQNRFPDRSPKTVSRTVLPTDLPPCRLLRREPEAPEVLKGVRLGPRTEALREPELLRQDIPEPRSEPEPPQLEPRSGALDHP